MPQNGGDPSGIPRPTTEDRVEKAGSNSGVIVGERVEHQPTTAGTVQPSPQTAFIKVYQDAGVIGLVMLTMVAVCVLLCLFCMRLIKLYSALAESANKIETARTVAVEKLASALLVLDSRVTAVIAELRDEHRDHQDSLRSLERRVEMADERSRASFELLSRALTSPRNPLAPRETEQ